ncbi:hypothetical protein E3P99_01502 [Wallemia hederae]|uniref:Large ribosomal subunit protein mL46 N-terminal domain-containing protein n=1 Tax=Wallemia hederae TaxID=1540922 RepID=A0A4T0FRI7_9BASI|nr:hypothetical protein E3P99_01502 [Wallemia hederae]
MSQSQAIKASVLIVRPPYITPQLSPFKDAYFQYNRLLTNALSSKFFVDFYYQQGSLSQRYFKQREHLRQLQEWGYSNYPDEQLTQPDLDVTENKRDSDDSLTSITRRGDRSVSLVLKDGSLPTAAVQPGESLDEAALRAAYTQLGRDIDLWLVSKLPIAVNKDKEGVDNYILLSYILNGKPAIEVDYPVKQEIRLPNNFVDLLPIQ